MKDKYDIFNDIKIDLNEYDNLEFSVESNKKFSNNIKSQIKKAQNNSFKKSFTTVASIATIILSIGIFNPSLADNIPLLNTLVDKIHLAIKNNIISKNDITFVEESSKNNGLEFIIDNAFCDNDNIYLDFTIKTDKEFNNTEYKNAIENIGGHDSLLIYDLYVSVNGNNLNSVNYDFPKVKYINNNTLTGNILITLPTNTMENIKDDTTNIGLNFKFIKNKQSKLNYIEMLDGNWKLNFKVNSNKKNISTTEINKTMNGFTLNNVKLSKSTLLIDASLIKNYYKFGDEFDIIEVRDNKNNILSSTSFSYKNNTKHRDNPRIIGTFDLNNINDDLNYITVIFYGQYDYDLRDSPILAKFKVNLND